MKPTAKMCHSRTITKRTPLYAQSSDPTTIFVLDLLIAALDLVIRQKN